MASLSNLNFLKQNLHVVSSLLTFDVQCLRRSFSDGNSFLHSVQTTGIIYSLCTLYICFSSHFTESPQYGHFGICDCPMHFFSCKSFPLSDLKVFWQLEQFKCWILSSQTLSLLSTNWQSSRHMLAWAFDTSNSVHIWPWIVTLTATLMLNPVVRGIQGIIFRPLIGHSSLKIMK